MKIVKVLAQENNLVRLFGEMTNYLDLSEKKTPLQYLKKIGHENIKIGLKSKGPIYLEKYWRNFHCQTDMSFLYLKLRRLNFRAKISNNVQ